MSSSQRLEDLSVVAAGLQDLTFVLYDGDGLERTAWGTPPAGLDGPLGEALVREIRSVLATGEPLRTTRETTLEAGTACYDVVLSPVRSEQGAVTGVLATQIPAPTRSETDSELRARDRRTRLLEEGSRALISECGPDGTVWYVSENHRAATGYGPEDLIGRSLEQIRDLMHAELQPPYGTDSPPGVEASHPVHRVVARDGSTKWFEAEIATGRKEDGDSSMLVISRDVTARVAAEAALRRNETRLRAAQRIARVGSWDWSPVTGDLEWSEECHRIFGQQPDQAPIEDTIRNGIHPDDRERAFAEITAGVTRGLLEDVEFRYVLPDGSEKIICTNGERNDGPDGPRFFGTVLDVTEMREAEAQRLASDQRSRAILSSLTTTKLVVWNPDYTIREVYGEETDVYGLRAQELPGVKAGAFLPEGHEQDGLAAVRSVFETGVPLEFEQRVCLPGGDFILDISLSPVRDRGGEIRNVIAVCHDVTERVRAEEEQAKLRARAQQSKRLESLGLLAGGIAHDFNNLLVGILGSAELAIRTLDESSPQHELLRNIQLAGQHAADLTTQLLSYAGQGRLDMVPVDLTAILEETKSLLDLGVHGDGRLRIEMSPVPLWIRADPAQIQRIAVNLVTNASEAVGDAAGRGMVSAQQQSLDLDPRQHRIAMFERRQ